jgi:putative sterol carrier protein
VVATVAECEQALEGLAAMLSSVDGSARRANIVERTLRCEVSDLDEVFTARISNEGLSDITRSGTADAQIKVKVRSDDLVALTKGELNFAAAWATGKLKIDASLTDLLKLRALL